MAPARSLLAGRIIAAAWTDRRVAAALVTDPAGTLRRRFGLVLDRGTAVTFLWNTGRVLHLPFGAVTSTAPASALSALRHYSEAYTDPRLEPLVWYARDPTWSARLIAAPVAILRSWDVPVPPGLAIRVLPNTASQVHIPLPARPRSTRIMARLAREFRVAGAPISVKHAALGGAAGSQAPVAGHHDRG